MDIQVLAGLWLATFIVLIVIVRRAMDYFERRRQNRIRYRMWDEEE